MCVYSGNGPSFAIDYGADGAHTMMQIYNPAGAFLHGAIQGNHIPSENLKYTAGQTANRSKLPCEGRTPVKHSS